MPCACNLKTNGIKDKLNYRNSYTCKKYIVLNHVSRTFQKNIFTNCFVLSFLMKNVSKIYLWSPIPTNIFTLIWYQTRHMKKEHISLCIKVTYLALHGCDIRVPKTKEINEQKIISVIFLWRFSKIKGKNS